MSSSSSSSSSDSDGDSRDLVINPSTSQANVEKDDSGDENAQNSPAQKSAKSLSGSSSPSEHSAPASPTKSVEKEDSPQPEKSPGSEKSPQKPDEQEEDSDSSAPRAKIVESDSDSDSPAPQKRSEETKTGDSDSDVDSPGLQKRQEDPTHEDLFGEGADLSSSDDDDRQKSPKPDRREGDEDEEDEITGPRMYLEDEEQEAERPPPETVIEVEAPRICADLGQNLHFVKFPNFLSVEPRPFDPETYEDAIDDDSFQDEEGRSRLKLTVENTIRWRQYVDEDGNIKKESNAKFVRWSDGSLSLYLGSEIFDVHLQPTAGDHNHLFVRQGMGLQGQAVFRTKLTFRPHSTDTLTHKKMTLSMADRSNKAQKVKVIADIGKDPEIEKARLQREVDERLRAANRREAQQRRIRERASGRAITAGFLDPDRDDDSEEGESIGAIKKSFKPGGRDFLRGYRGSSSGEEDSDEGGKRLQKAKRLESDEDDDEAEKHDNQPASKKKKIIEESDSDEDKDEKEEEEKDEDESD